MMRGLALGLCLVATSAAAGPGENALSLGAGYATYVTPSPDEDDDGNVSPTVGGVATVTFERGVTEYGAWRVRAAGGQYTSDEGTAVTGLVTAGVSYRLDVLKYVPYAAIGVGALARSGGPFETGIEPAIELSGGVDWLLGRSRSVGLDIAATDVIGDTTTLAITLRSTWRWGFF